MNGAKALLTTLKNQGVKHIFGITGASVIPLFDEHYKDDHGIRYVHTVHEQGAVHAAEGYARASGKAGVCISTSGPGATNLVTGIMDAYMDSTPIIAISGQVSTNLLGCDAFQESNMVEITKSITKANFQVKNSNEMESTINKAFHLALNGRQGPIHIDIPRNFFNEEVTEPEIYSAPKIEHSINFEKIKKSAELLLNAEKPLILVGGGVLSSNASNEITEFATKFGIPVTTTLMGKTAFPENHPLSLGILGMHGRKSANYAIVHADVILAIGTRFNDRITGNINSFLEHGKLIHVDIDTKEHGKNVKNEIEIHADAKVFLKELIKVSQSIVFNKETTWSEKIKELAKECNCNINIDSSPIDPKRIIYELNKVLGESDIVTTGVGQHQMFAAHFLKRTKPRTFISSGGAGTMGYGFPAAIGAKVACPDVEVFDVDGDGSFGMVVQELGTCKEENIKVTPIIFNNSYYGMVRQWLELFYEKRYSAVKLSSVPDFVKLAEAYSLNGISVEKPSEIEPALKQAIKNDETTVINVKIAEESNITPMFGAGAHVSDMFGSCVPEGYFKKLLK